MRQFEGVNVNRGMGLVLAGMLVAFPGCAKSATDDGNRAARSVGGRMPTATPNEDSSYAGDQKQVKQLTKRTIAYEDYETFIKTAAESESESEVVLLTDIDASPEDMDASTEDGDTPEDTGDETGDEDATPVNAELVDGRPIFDQVPAHPGGLRGSPVDTVKSAAESAARKNLIRTVLAYQINPATTIADLLEAEPSEVELGLLSAQVVLMTWLDETTFEVEIQIRAGDIVSELKSKFDEADFSPLKSIDQNKYFTAKGVGKI